MIYCKNTDKVHPGCNYVNEKTDNREKEKKDFILGLSFSATEKSDFIYFRILLLSSILI